MSSKESELKMLIKEAKEQVREAKQLVLMILEEPMTMDQKKQILELYKLLK